jgi:hypothetical protein
MMWTSHICPTCGAATQAPLDDVVFCGHRNKAVECKVIGRANVQAAEARREHSIDKLVASMLTLMEA